MSSPPGLFDAFSQAGWTMICTMMVKILAVIDSGPEANTLSETMMLWIPLKPSVAESSNSEFGGVTSSKGSSGRFAWCEVSCAKRCHNHEGLETSLERGQSSCQEEQDGADDTPASGMQHVDAACMGWETI